MINETERLAERLVAAGHWVSLDFRVAEKTAAEVIGVSGRTLRTWRKLGTGPRFIVAGKLTYRLSSLLEYLAAREI